MTDVKNLIIENEGLKARNEYLEKCVTALKEHNAKITKERNDLYEDYFLRIDECNRLFGELQDIKHMSMWEFAAKYCSDEEMEEAGHQLARSLLGGA